MLRSLKTEMKGNLRTNLLTRTWFAYDLPKHSRRVLDYSRFGLALFAGTSCRGLASVAHETSIGCASIILTVRVTSRGVSKIMTPVVSI